MIFEIVLIAKLFTVAVLLVGLILAIQIRFGDITDLDEKSWFVRALRPAVVRPRTPSEFHSVEEIPAQQPSMSRDLVPQDVALAQSDPQSVIAAGVKVVDILDASVYQLSTESSGMTVLGVDGVVRYFGEKQRPAKKTYKRLDLVPTHRSDWIGTLAEDMPRGDSEDLRGESISHASTDILSSFAQYTGENAKPN